MQSSHVAESTRNIFPSSLSDCPIFANDDMTLINTCICASPLRGMQSNWAWKHLSWKNWNWHTIQLLCSDTNCWWCHLHALFPQLSPIEYSIKFKVSVLIFKVLSGLDLGYRLPQDLNHSWALHYLSTETNLFQGLVPDCGIHSQRS